MKKIPLVVFTFLTINTLVACGNSDTVEPEIKIELTHEYVENFIDNIDINEVIFDDFQVPTTIEELPITWTSDHEDLELNDDDIIVLRDDEDKEVLLTANATFEDVLYTKSFNVFVPNDEFNELGNVSDYIDDHSFVLNYLNYTMSNTYNYETKITGSTEGRVKISFFYSDVKQNINSYAYKYEDITAYEINSETEKSPTGYKINVYQKALFTPEVIKLSHARESITDTTPMKTLDLNTYLNDYGVSQYCDFTGYNITPSDIESSSYASNGENHSFTYNITPGNSSVNKTQQLTVFGKLEEVDITSISFTILVDDNFNLISMNSTEIFNANMEGYSASLTQKLTTTYNIFNPEETPVTSLGFDRYYIALQG